MIRAMVKTFKRADMVMAFRLFQVCNVGRECADIVDTFGSWRMEETKSGERLIIVNGNGGFARMVWKRDQGVILNQAVALCGSKLLECNCTAIETDTECLWCLDELMRMDCKFVRELIIMWVSSMPKDKHEKAKKNWALSKGHANHKGA
jgi:hypothetical protein